MPRATAIFACLCCILAAEGAALAQPAAAGRCLDVENGTVHESYFGACLPGEQAILPEDDGAATGDNLAGADAANTAALPTPAEITIEPLPPAQSAPSTAMSCLDPGTGAIRQSDTGECFLGERQVLPEAARRRPVPAAPAPSLAPAPALAPELARCLAPTPAVAESEEAVRAAMGAVPTAQQPHPPKVSVSFGSGRLIVAVGASSGNATYMASLARLSRHIGVEADPASAGQARLTLTCATGNCWTTTSPHDRRETHAVTFLAKDQQQAEHAARALDQLIEQCGGGRETAEVPVADPAGARGGAD
jgi:hypothetical protein